MKRIVLLSLFFLLTTATYSQVGIGTTDPDASSILDLSSTNKGLLIPRVNLSTNPINSPAEGLLVYNTHSDGGFSPGFYYRSATEWKSLDGSGGGGDGSVKAYGERYYNNDATIQLLQYTEVRNLPAGVKNSITTANIETNTLGLRPKVRGVYRVTLTVTYSKESVNNNVNSVEFYLSKNTNMIENTAIRVDLNNDLKRRTLTMVKLLNLEAYQTYHFGISTTGPGGAGVDIPKIILHKNLTNMTIELISI